MEKSEALKWLNHRISLGMKLGRYNHYDIIDIVFFKKFIYERSGVKLETDRIVYSILNYPESCSIWVDNLYNYLILKYNIEVEVNSRSKIINFK